MPDTSMVELAGHLGEAPAGESFSLSNYFDWYWWVVTSQSECQVPDVDERAMREQRDKAERSQLFASVEVPRG